MVAHSLIQKLRGETFCLYEILESGTIPETLLGELICDYVVYLQSRLLRKGMGMHTKGLDAIRIKRFWLQGKASNVQLGRIRAIVQQQMACNPADEALFFAWAATFASSEKAMCAVLEGLRRRTGELPISFENEVQWMGRRLARAMERHMETVSKPWLPLPQPPEGIPLWAFSTQAQ